MPELQSDKKRKRHDVNPEQIRSAIKLKREWKPESRIFLLSRFPKGKIKYYQTWAFHNSGGQI